MEHIELRRTILKCLYETFKEYPYAAVELNYLEEKCNTDVKSLNWNIVYLEKCGYVELAKSVESYSYVALSATITAIGIDLIENEFEFNKKFSIKQL
ncbi:MAG: hypothetical protein HQK76_00645 [Desulfobacterales bacterium]|nr:hypothetical protein [Desulfobacterales bacterium]